MQNFRRVSECFTIISPVPLLTSTKIGIHDAWSTKIGKKRHPKNGHEKYLALLSILLVVYCGSLKWLVIIPI